MGDFTMIDYHELDVLCANLELENKELKAKNKMLEEECSALRDQLRNLERQVYNGPTM